MSQTKTKQKITQNKETNNAQLVTDIRGKGVLLIFNC